MPPPPGGESRDRRGTDSDSNAAFCMLPCAGPTVCVGTAAHQLPHAHLGRTSLSRKQDAKGRARQTCESSPLAMPTRLRCAALGKP